MKRVDHDPAGVEPSPENNDGATGLPLLHTWKAVYLFVIACFLLWAGLLVVLTVIFP